MKQIRHGGGKERSPGNFFRLAGEGGLSEEYLKLEEAACSDLGRNIPGRGDSKFKGHKVETLVCLRR